MTTPLILRGTDIANCEGLLDDIPLECTETAGTLTGMWSCDQYITQAANCLQKLNWEMPLPAAGYWSGSLMKYVTPYLNLAKVVNEELGKSSYTISDAYRMTSAIRNIFFASISFVDTKPIDVTSRALTKPLSQGAPSTAPVEKSLSKTFNSAIGYIKTVKPGKNLPIGTTLGDKQDAAMLFMWALATDRNDPMKPGWEQKYLPEMAKFFRPRPLKK